MRRRYRRSRSNRNTIIATVGGLTVVLLLVMNLVRMYNISLKSKDAMAGADGSNVQAQVTAEPNGKEDGIEETKATAVPTTKPTAKPKYVGVSEAGKKYTTDASVVAKKLSKYDYYNDGKKTVYLTFDDGVSTTVTPKILEVLDKYKVKATFFVMGKNIENGGEAAKKLIKEEFEKGHAIANHSYSHDYKVLYPNRELNLKNFVKDFKKTDKILKDILGDEFSTRVIRCPGGFMSWKNMDELSNYMKKNNMVSIDWNALSKDAEGPKKNAKQLLECVKETAGDKTMVVLLMHDTYGKEETVKSLPLIIEYFKKKGYEFKTLS